MKKLLLITLIALAGMAIGQSLMATSLAERRDGCDKCVGPQGCGDSWAKNISQCGNCKDLEQKCASKNAPKNCRELLDKCIAQANKCTETAGNTLNSCLKECWKKFDLKEGCSPQMSGSELAWQVTCRNAGTC